MTCRLMVLMDSASRASTGDDAGGASAAGGTCGAGAADDGTTC